jgi:hypothetical protein
MTDAYGLEYSSALLDAVLDRQEENLQHARARADSSHPAVAAYGRASAAWQREQ